MSAAACAAPLPQPGAPWIAETAAPHPLLNAIVEVDTGTVLSLRETVDRAAAADHVLIGERHDHPDHHVIQAFLIDAVAARGRPPTVVFEMITMDEWPGLSAHLEFSRRDTRNFGRAVDWEERGWPDWAMYEPIARAIANRDLAVLPGGPRPNTEDLARTRGLAVMSSDLRARTGLDDPLPAALAEDLEAELIAAHCHALNQPAARRAARVQRLRDATMAYRMLSTTGNTVLIAGAGHTRRDRGVPWYMNRAAPEADVLSMGLIEVEADALTVSDYGDLPYDVVWFTPALPSTDWCAVIRQMQEDARAGKPVEDVQPDTPIELR